MKHFILLQNTDSTNEYKKKFIKYMAIYENAIVKTNNKILIILEHELNNTIYPVNVMTT